MYLCRRHQQVGQGLAVFASRSRPTVLPSSVVATMLVAERLAGVAAREGGSPMDGTTTIASLLDTEPASSGLTEPQRTAGQQRPETVPASQPSPAHRVQLRVVWGDLTLIPADVHVVGHYNGVLPSSAEQAVDRAISTQREVIADHTRRRWLVGELGAITYFPGVDPSADGGVAVRRVAVVGMGRLGAFNETRATLMYSSLLRELGALPHICEVAVVLIGSGAHNLSISQAARALLRGFQSVLASASTEFALDGVTLVELDRLRAEQLVAALSGLRDEAPLVDLATTFDHGRGGVVGPDSAAVYALRALSTAVRRQGSPGRRRTSIVNQLNESLPADLRALVSEQLAAIPEGVDLLSVAISNPTADVSTAAPRQIDTDPPTRISVSYDSDRMRWAALTARATVPERYVPTERTLIDELVQRLTAPSEEDAARLPRMLRRLVVPEELQPHITGTGSVPIVFELDSAAAQLPWEFMTDREYDDAQTERPLAVRTAIARQLRTSYARLSPDFEEGTGLRALVIADPAPGKGHLPQAREEGIAVWELMRSRGLEAKLFVGSAQDTNQPPAGATFATKLDVLNELIAGRYDLVHFAGHGTMGDPERPELAGWVFAGGNLTARALVQLAWAPRLVMANACWSASGLGSPGAAANKPVEPEGQVEREPVGPDKQLRARLTTVLADEFLRVGIAHYIGTSWRIPDTMGADFATAFYERILPSAGHRGQPIGRALSEARAVLWKRWKEMAPSPGLPAEVGCAWAAYQHYGDPTDSLAPANPTAGVGTTRGGL
jgi:hypothetical protein